MSEIKPIERRLKLHDMRVLMSVIQFGSKGKAAERLGSSQPAISRSIAELEYALGVRLIDRSPKGIEPTLYGRALIKRGLTIFDELQQSIKDIEFLADPNAGELRIGASIAVAVGFASAVIDRLNRKYPKARFQLSTSDTGAAMHALVERKVDLVIAHIVEPITEELIRAEILFHEPHIVVAGRRSRWARRSKVKLVELMDEPWTLPPPESQFGAVVSEAFRANGFELPQMLITSSLPVRSVLAGSGRYLTMIPRNALMIGSHLRPLPIDLPTTRRPLAIVTLKHRTLNPLAMVFIEEARGSAKAMASFDRRSRR
jgi:DNA-binding transcriptional LysR family regulator